MENTYIYFFNILAFIKSFLGLIIGFYKVIAFGQTRDHYSTMLQISSNCVNDLQWLLVLNPEWKSWWKTTFNFKCNFKAIVLWTLLFLFSYTESCTKDKHCQLRPHFVDLGGVLLTGSFCCSYICFLVYFTAWKVKALNGTMCQKSAFRVMLIVLQI